MDLLTIIGIIVKIIVGIIAIVGGTYKFYQWWKSARKCKANKGSEKNQDKSADINGSIESKLEILHDLPETEQQILRIYIKSKALTCLLDVLPNKPDRWAINSLEEKGIIYKTPHERQILFQRPYSIHHWAYKYLRNHPECLYSEEELKHMDHIDSNG